MNSSLGFAVLAFGAYLFAPDGLADSTQERWFKIEVALCELGHCQQLPDGQRDDATYHALRAWQKSRGFDQNGYYVLSGQFDILMDQGYYLHFRV